MARAPRRWRPPTGHGIGLWETATYGEPVAAPLSQVAELLQVELAAVTEAAKEVPPYLTAAGEPRWSVYLLGVRLGVRERHRPPGHGRPRPSVCKRGHSLTDHRNVYVRPDGHRACKVCQRERRQQRRAAS